MSNGKPATVTTKTTVSLAAIGLFVTIFGGNFLMVSNVKEKVGSLDTVVVTIGEDIHEIKDAVMRLTNETHAEVRDLRNQMKALEVDMARLKASSGEK